METCVWKLQNSQIAMRDVFVTVSCSNGEVE
jgi:hypothetical protein